MTDAAEIDDGNSDVIMPSLTPAKDIDPALQSSDPSSEPGDPQAQKPKNPVQDRVDKITAKKWEETRRADNAERRAEEAEAQLKQAQPQQTPELPTAPALPEDTFDEDAMREYHEKLAVHQTTVAAQAGKDAYKQEKQAENKARQDAEGDKIYSGFVTAALRDGVDGDKLHAAEQALNNAGISEQLGAHIMTDANGGKIATYLHDNPALMHEIIGMDPMQAAIKINNEVKSAALSATPNSTQAPDPIPDISGSGAVVKDDFEKDFPGTVFI